MDRNCAMQIVIIVVDTSLSARRAWIEIVISAMTGQISVVALRKESVDRNIQIKDTPKTKKVALRKESVDRNSIMGMI